MPRLALAPRSLLAWSLSHCRPLLRAVAERGLLASAPLSLAFLALCLGVSALWAGQPAAHHLAAACCAYHGWPGWSGIGRWRDQPGGPVVAGPGAGAGPGDLVRLVGSAFLLRHPLEVAWAIIATVLVIAPLEVQLGSRRLAVVAASGHLVPTLVVAVSGLGQVQRLGGGGLDVGASAVIVASAAALAYRTRSPFVITWVLAAQLIDLGVDTPLAGAEHLMALLTGVLTAWALGLGEPAQPLPSWLEAAARVRARWRERKGGRVPRSVSSGPSHEGPVPP